MTNWWVTGNEREYLRELAKKQLEYARLPVMKERGELWYRHNDLKGDIPMIHFETWTCEQELLPPPKCTSEAAKWIELQLQRNILNHECIGDDRVVTDTFDIDWDIKFILFNIPIERAHSKDSQGRDVGHQFLYAIKDIKEDMGKLGPSLCEVDRERTQLRRNFVEEILGDILTVRIGASRPGASLTQDVVHLMGMETMIYSLVDYPEEMQEFMSRLTREHVDFMKWMEKEGLLVLNNGSNMISQGTFGFSRKLPEEGYNPKTGVQLNNLWGYMDSQETVSISPDMFGEFFFPYYLEVAKNFGRLNYGCCEPVHSIWDKYISKLPNLRKVSISPWCDEEFMGEVLKGTSVIYHRKPSPNFVGVGRDLDEEAFRAHIRKSVLCARDGKMEFSFRDVYTLGGNPGKLKRAIAIVREVLADHWK